MACPYGILTKKIAVPPAIMSGGAVRNKQGGRGRVSVLRVLLTFESWSVL